MPLVRKLCSLALAVGVGACIIGTAPARAADKAIRITIPKRSKPTPVQKLNRDGVKAIEKHDYRKAKTLFYRAYLIDPNDPFTLNNLGYVAELEGDVDRAQRFYDLAAEQSSDATVDRATIASVVGKPVGKVAGQAQDAAMEVNRLNVAAIGLLQKDRAPEADLILQKALKLDPKNPYTLNNLGYANEKEGELETALNYYSAAANLNSREPVVVTAIADWRGKPISEIAARNAEKVQKEMKRAKTVEQQVASFNLRGVSALNRNDRREARQYFEQANKLNPSDAFTLNNMGYLAELDGDRETAEFYYQKAQDAKRANATVGVATRRDAEGQKLAAVANTNNQDVDQAFQKIIQEKRQQGGPVLLKRRDNTPIVEPDKPPPPLPEPEATAQPSAPQAGAPAGAAPAPAGAPAGQPAPASNAPNGGVIEPLPDNAQPPGANTGSVPPPANAPQQNAPQGGVIEPLPDNQQPPNANTGNVPPPANAPQQGAPQQQSNPPQGQAQGGVIEPLPDNQQPPNANTGNVPPPANAPQQGTPQQQSNPPQSPH